MEFTSSLKIGNRQFSQLRRGLLWPPVAGGKVGNGGKFSDFIERKDLGITHKDFQRVFPRVCDVWGEVVLLISENSLNLNDFGNENRLCSR